MAVEETQVPQIALLVDDLEAIRAALNSAHMCAMAEDLASQYRKLSNRQQYSPLTRVLGKSLAMVEGYINDEVTEEDEDGVS